jgi:hypothetical protein
MATNLICVEKTIGHKQLNRGKKNLVIAMARNIEATNYCDNEISVAILNFNTKLFWWQKTMPENHICVEKTIGQTIQSC